MKGLNISHHTSTCYYLLVPLVSYIPTSVWRRRVQRHICTCRGTVTVDDTTTRWSTSPADFRHCQTCQSMESSSLPAVDLYWTCTGPVLDLCVTEGLCVYTDGRNVMGTVEPEPEVTGHYYCCVETFVSVWPLNCCVPRQHFHVSFCIHATCH